MHRAAIAAAPGQGLGDPHPVPGEDSVERGGERGVLVRIRNFKPPS